MSFDLLVGVTVFMLTLGFAFATISGMVDPYVGGQEHTLVADRVATHLADGAFATDDPSVVDAACTFGFFNASYLANNGSECRISFQANESDVTERIGIDGRYSVNVSIRRDTDGDGIRETMCTDGDELLACPAETPLTAGPRAPTTHSSVVSARRTIVLDEVDVVLEVRVW